MVFHGLVSFISYDDFLANRDTDVNPLAQLISTVPTQGEYIYYNVICHLPFCFLRAF